MAKKRSTRLKSARPAKGCFPIFILGIERRSGTHYLQQLLTLHPDCALFPLEEDRFVASSSWLRGYADSVVFDNRWSWHPSTKDRLIGALGQGIEGLIQSQDVARHLVLKTPSCSGIMDFPRMFPGSRLIILVRDGRDTVESYVRTWRSEYEKVMLRWASSAKELIAFLKKHGRDPRVTVTRYEDLYQNPRKEMTRILKALGLGTKSYDFDRAGELGVYGSSSFPGKQVSWHHSMKRSDRFRPVGKAAHWPRERKELYRKVAGRYARALGYPVS